MTTANILLKELETMPEEATAEVLDFAMFLKKKHASAKKKPQISIKDAYGIFNELKGMDATIDRDEEDSI